MGRRSRPIPIRRAPERFDATDPAVYPAAGWAPLRRDRRALRRRAARRRSDARGRRRRCGRGPDAPPGDPVLEALLEALGRGIRAVRARGRRRATAAATSRPAPRRPLPRVSFWSIWNEPNYGIDLAPQAIDQSTRSRSRPRSTAGCVDAAWSALQATGHGHDTILIGETRPARASRPATTPATSRGWCRCGSCGRCTASTCATAAARGRRDARGCPATAAAPRAFARRQPGAVPGQRVRRSPLSAGAFRPTWSTPHEPDYADLAAIGQARAHARPRCSGLRLEHAASRSTRPSSAIRPTRPRRSAGRSTPKTAAYLPQLGRVPDLARSRGSSSWTSTCSRTRRRGNFATGLEFANGTPKATLLRLPDADVPAGQDGRCRPGARAVGWGSPRGLRTICDAPPAVGRIEFHARGGSGFNVLRRITLSGPHGYFDTRIVVPSTGIISLGWAYPDGTAIHSRIVKVTIR